MIYKAFHGLVCFLSDLMAYFSLAHSLISNHSGFLAIALTCQAHYCLRAFVLALFSLRQYTSPWYLPG